MSLVKRQNSKFWYVQFQIDHQTVIRSTRTTDRKVAEQVATKIRSEAHSEIVLGRRKPLTLEGALIRFVDGKVGDPEFMQDWIDRWQGLRTGDFSNPSLIALVGAQGAEIGVVTSGTLGPTVNQPVALAYLQTSHAAVGTPVQAVVRGKPYFNVSYTPEAITMHARLVPRLAPAYDDCVATWHGRRVAITSGWTDIS